MIRRFILLSLLAFTASLLRGQNRPVNLESDFGEIDGKTNEQVLRGNARVTDGVMLITADEIRRNLATETITGTGHVVFTRGPVRLLADKLVLDRRTQTFTAERVRFGAHPYYAEGESAAGSMEEITLNRATVTYGEPGPWQPTFRADKIIYAPGQRLRAENALAGIGHLQPLPFPRFQQSLKESFVSSFATLNGGYRASLGAFAEAGLHLPVSPSVRLGADLGIYSARGVMFGPSGSYNRAANSADGDTALRGYFRSGYINDHGDKKSDLLGRPVPENRGYVEWQHEQKLSENLSLNAQLNWWKDSEILRDFRPRTFFPVQAPDTFVEAVYAGKNYFLSAFGRFQPNSFQRVQERLPELRFDLLPVTVGNGFVERFHGAPPCSAKRKWPTACIDRCIRSSPLYSFRCYRPLPPSSSVPDRSGAPRVSTPTTAWNDLLPTAIGSRSPLSPAPASHTILTRANPRFPPPASPEFPS